MGSENNETKTHLSRFAETAPNCHEQTSTKKSRNKWVLSNFFSMFYVSLLQQIVKFRTNSIIYAVLRNRICLKYSRSFSEVRKVVCGFLPT